MQEETTETITGVNASKISLKSREMATVHTLADGSVISIRPVCSTDEAMLVQFHRGLSGKSVYLRYFTPVSFDWRTNHRRMAQLCSNDPSHQLTLVVERRRSLSNKREIVAIGRLIIDDGSTSGEFAVVVGDAFQGQGLGRRLVRRLQEHGRLEGLAQLTASVLPENRAMLELCRAEGFEIHMVGASEPLEISFAL